MVKAKPSAVFQFPHTYEPAVVEFVTRNGGTMCGDLFVKDGDTFVMTARTKPLPMSDTLTMSVWDSIIPQDQCSITNTNKLIANFASVVKAQRRQTAHHACEQAKAHSNLEEHRRHFVMHQQIANDSVTVAKIAAGQTSPTLGKHPSLILLDSNSLKRTRSGQDPMHLEPLPKKNVAPPSSEAKKEKEAGLISNIMGPGLSGVALGAGSAVGSAILGVGKQAGKQAIKMVIGRKTIEDTSHSV
jgi:hypothetical protein